MCSRTTFLCGIVFALTIPYATAGAYSGGSGTADDPYQIGTPDDILEMSATPADWSAHFLMIAGVNMLGHTFDRAVIAPDTDSSAAAFQGALFTGVFDGNGHVIRNLTIDASDQDYVALFGAIGPGGCVQNLEMAETEVTARDFVGSVCGRNGGLISECQATGVLTGGQHVGGLCGLSNTDGVIRQSGAAATVTGTGPVGGLCGRNGGTIEDSRVGGTVTGVEPVGGLCGENVGEIERCDATAEVTGEQQVGGLCGVNKGGTIVRSRAAGTVAGTQYVGGLCGRNWYQSNISESHAEGAVQGTMDVGGLCGWNQSGDISSCYARAVVVGPDNAANLGGLVGTNRSSIECCWAGGSVSAGDGAMRLGGLCGLYELGFIEQCYAASAVSAGQDCQYLGGLCGDAESWLFPRNSFWDMEASGLSSSHGGIGLPTAQMKSKETFVQANWDFTYDLGDPADWYMPVDDYPRLAWDAFDGGDGTAGSPYQVSEPGQLIVIGQHSQWLDKHYVLTADIDMEGRHFTNSLIGAYNSGVWPREFVGTFDGAGHTIRNLTITGGTYGSYLGLFGVIGRDGHVTNLGVDNISVTGGQELPRFIGGLCGMNYGMISNCYTVGHVSGWQRVGGLCGGNDGGTIERCWAGGTVLGTLGVSHSPSSLGGLCGGNGGESREPSLIADCYSMASVSAAVRAGSTGGLCGSSNGRVENCYAVGLVNVGEGSYNVGGLCGYAGDAQIINSFWDGQTSGQTTSSGGIRRTTAQMQQEASFIGWNNGAWTIDESNDYPRLCWENKPGKVMDYVYPRSYAGDGIARPFEIATAADLLCLSRRPDDWDKSFVVLADIDMSEVSDFWPISEFCGRFDGAGHVIGNLVIDSLQIGNRCQLGLFSRVTAGAEVLNLGFENVSVSGPDHAHYLAALCAFNLGDIIRCHASGHVTTGDSSHELGGLCAANGGELRACHAAVDVSGGDGSSFMGGLCGHNWGTITDSHSRGAVQATRFVGGLCGSNGLGTIRRAYATGAVTANADFGGLVAPGSYAGPTETSFWDVDSTGVTVSAGGTGLPTAQMQTLATFLDAGWDFLDEGDNGTQDTWRMCADGVDYPRLAWEFAGAGDVDCPDGVGIEDVWYLSGRWLATTPATIGAADPTGDGVADLADLAILAAHWLAVP